MSKQLIIPVTKILYSCNRTWVKVKVVAFDIPPNWAIPHDDWNSVTSKHPTQDWQSLFLSSPHSPVPFLHLGPVRIVCDGELWHDNKCKFFNGLLNLIICRTIIIQQYTRRVSLSGWGINAWFKSTSCFIFPQHLGTKCILLKHPVRCWHLSIQQD